MNKNKYRLGMCIFLGLVLTGLPSIVNAIPKQQLPHYAYHYTTVWDDEYQDGFCAWDVAIDTQKNVIIGGYDMFYNGKIVKYDGSTGEVLWDGTITDAVLSLNAQQSQPLQGDGGEDQQQQQQQHNIEDYVCLRDFMQEIWHEKYSFAPSSSELAVLVGGVDTDAQNNIVFVATVYDLSTEAQPSDVYVAKYDAEGNMIWEILLDIFIWDQSQAIAIDSSNNVIIAGISMGVDFGGEIPLPIPDGWVYKLSGADGEIMKMSNIFGLMQPLPYYFAVDTDMNNNVFPVGLALSINWSNFPDNFSATYTALVKKFNTNLQALNTYTGSGEVQNWLMAVTIDANGYVYAGGDINLPYTYEYIVKLSNNLGTKYWELTDRYQVSGSVMGLATMPNGNLVAAIQKFMISQPGSDDFNTKLFNPSGILLLHITEGGNWQGEHMYAASLAVATDSDNNVVVTGAREYSTQQLAYMYTMKYHITNSIIIIHPAEPGEEQGNSTPL